MDDVTRRIMCRLCGDTIDTSKGPEHVSGWSHTHPSVCPGRHDSMPSLNGVHVGDLWRNSHTGNVVRIMQIKLGGAQTYTDREPCVIAATVWDQPDDATLDSTVEPTAEQLRDVLPIESSWWHATPLWSLAEHWDPLTRPGEYPVPWSVSTSRGHETRSVDERWRCPGYRHPEEPEKDERDKAYWHAWHTVIGYGIQWEHTNVLWQVDPGAPDELPIPRQPRKRVPRETPAAAAQERSGAVATQESLF